VNELIAAEIKRRLPKSGRRVVFVCGLGGAGKTQFCLNYSKMPGLEGPALHVDWYLKYASLERRARMAAAVASGDPERIEAEENPINWEDWPALTTAITTLRGEGRLGVTRGWNQLTGEKDFDTTLEAADDAVIWCDGVMLQHPGIAEFADTIVLLEVSDETDVARGEARDGHRNDAEYLAYKRGLKKKYDLPYFERYRDVADLVINNNDFDNQKIVI
jgi:uridine kinase